MADLDNVLDEIDINDPDDQQRLLNDEDEDEIDIQDATGEDPPRRSAVPSALEAAAARRQQLQDKDLGIGREERDYQEASQDSLEEGDEDGEGRALDPDYEQLRSLWISELVCPELFPNNDEIVSVHADLLPEIEESIDELIQQSRQQRQSSRDGQASGELASLMAQISKMDLDRTRFMLVDLARTRMAKIENHALHNRTLVDRMTEQEVRERERERERTREDGRGVIQSSSSVRFCTLSNMESFWRSTIVAPF